MGQQHGHVGERGTHLRTGTMPRHPFSHVCTWGARRCVDPMRLDTLGPTSDFPMDGSGHEDDMHAAHACSSCGRPWPLCALGCEQCSQCRGDHQDWHQGQEHTRASSAAQVASDGPEPRTASGTGTFTPSLRTPATGLTTLTVTHSSALSEVCGDNK